MIIRDEAVNLQSNLALWLNTIDYFVFMVDSRTSDGSEQTIQNILGRKAPFEILPYTFEGFGPARTLSLKAAYKYFQSECNVVIDTDKSGSIRIIGQEESVVLAESKIITIVNTVTEEFVPLEEAIVCLTLGKASLLQQLQNVYGVRIDVSRANKVCKITGLPENIAGTKAEIALIQCKREVIPFEESVLPFIIGKGGATIRALEEEHSVQLDISRESKVIVVMGYIDDVKAAGTILRDIITENKEVEEAIEVDKNTLMGCIIGSKGLLVKNLQKELSVYLKTEKSESSNTEKLVIRGIVANVLPAKQHLLDLIAAYNSDTTICAFTDDCVAALVGKKGAKINAIREEHPLVTIDVDSMAGYVRLHSTDAAAREAAKNVIEGIILANQTAVVHLDADTAVTLKGARGTELRNYIVQELGLNMDIMVESEQVKLRGTKEALEKGVTALEVFRDTNFIGEVFCLEEDSSALFAGGNDCPAKVLEQQYGVEISHDKKNSIVRIRGRKDAVDGVQTAMHVLLEGGEGSGTQLIPIDGPSMGSLIGKGGANIKKLETDYNVKVDFLRSRGMLRIRGETDDVQNAKNAIITSVQNTRIMASVFVPRDYKEADRKSIVTSTAALFFGSEIETANGGGELIIRGPQRIVNETKKYLSEQFNGSAVAVVELLPMQFQTIAPQADLNFSQIRNSYKVKVELDDTNDSVVITGPTTTIGKALTSLYRMLDYLFPDEFATIPMDSLALAEAGSHACAVEIMSKTGAFLQADYRSLCVRVRGEPESVIAAKELLPMLEAQWRNRSACLKIEDFMIPVLVGKKGANILAIEKDTGASINVDRVGLRIIVSSGTDDGAVASAVAALTSRIDRLRKEMWEITLDDKMFGPMIGKQGSHVNKLRAETGANIDIDPKTMVLRVRDNFIESLH